MTDAEHRAYGWRIHITSSEPLAAVAVRGLADALAADVVDAIEEASS